MPTAIVTGSGGLIGSESVAPLRRAGFDVIGIENDMRARFFGPEASTAATTRAPRRASSTSFRLADARHPRRRRRRARLRRARARPRAGRPHRRAAVARLGGAATRRPTSASTPTARSTCSRPRARTRPTRPFIFTSTNKVYGDTPNRLPLVEHGDAARAARGPPLLRRHRHDDVDRPLACTRCSASPRRPPTCWCRSTGATSTCRRSASAAAA